MVEAMSVQESEFHVLRQALRHHFMDPIEKWNTKGVKPWKLVVQILKIVFVTAQVIVFGNDMARFITYQDEMQMTHRQLFLKDWDPSADSIGFPQADAPYAVYTQPEFYETINYAIKMFSGLPDIMVVPFSYTTNDTRSVSPIQFCVEHYDNIGVDHITGQSSLYNYSMTTHQECQTIENYAPAGDAKWTKFDIRTLLKNGKVNFATLVGATIDMSIRTVLFERMSNPDDDMACFDVDIHILFDNRHRDGQITIALTSKPHQRECHKNKMPRSIVMSDFITRHLLYLIVLAFCSASLALCFRSLCRSDRLRRFTDHMLLSRGYVLTKTERLEFYDSWLVLIVINDVLILIATLMLLFYDQRLLETNNYTVCSLLLGIGNLLSWSGLLRYLSFFRRYNLLIITLRRSFIHVMRFMLCTLIIYCGFCFCGWVVFGPYHFKFRQLSTTTECLFSLLNGDDMFDTFVLLRSTNISVWWFSRLYLYLFVILFIYVVLSLFIAIIMDSYEIIKQYDQQGFPKSRLMKLCDTGELPVDEHTDSYETVT